MINEFTIFYTDDDAEDLEFFIEASNSLGKHLNIVTQNSGVKLLEDLKNPPPNPHIIFLDLNMPGLSGFDVLETLGKNGSLKKFPIIVFSTSSDESIIKKSRELGASYYISKPTDFSVLKKTIQHALTINWSTFIPNKDNFVYCHS